MHMFMMNWYEKFPSFKARALYLTGESYAGLVNMTLDLILFFDSDQV